MTLQLPSFLDASFVERVVVYLRRNLEWEPDKKPLIQWVELRKKTEGQIRISQLRREADESQRIMLLVKNLPTRWRETKEENRWLLKEGRLSMKNLLTQGEF